MGNCPTCGGAGFFNANYLTCPRCNGTGDIEIIEDNSEAYQVEKQEEPSQKKEKSDTPIIVFVITAIITLIVLIYMGIIYLLKKTPDAVSSNPYVVLGIITVIILTVIAAHFRKDPKTK